MRYCLLLLFLLLTSCHGEKGVQKTYIISEHVQNADQEGCTCHQH